MPENLKLSVGAFVSLTDEALLVVDPKSKSVSFASPRALDMLDIDSRENPENGFSIFQVFDPDDGRLQEFLSTAQEVSSPLIARVQRRSDNAAIIAKAHRVSNGDGAARVIVKLTGDTELSRRFRLLAEKISALDLEVEHRKAVEDQLSRNAVELERTLIAVRQMSELDVSDPHYLNHALDAVVAASDSTSALVIGQDAGHVRIMASTGDVSGLIDTEAPIALNSRFEELWDKHRDSRLNDLRQAVQSAIGEDYELTEITALPLFLGGSPKGGLILLSPPQAGPAEVAKLEAEILSEALANLMNRANVEADLRHSQKLQAIGELTGGIAHDFNNILAAILGNAELILDHVDQCGTESTEVELANAVRDAALRGATLTSRLLSFARKQPLRPKSVSLNTVLRNLDPLLRRSIGEHLDLELVGAGGLWETRLDLGQFENAVLNLVINARDAMPRGGKLTVETANTRLDADYAAQHTEVLPGQYVLVAVSDAGTGMKPDVVREAFTPFFTTKGVGKGSGLGLSMVFGFVKQSGGHVKIYSEEGHGTTVKMYFPRHIADPKRTSNAADARPLGQPRGAGHVLLVEDDPAILLYAERTLKALGYTADTALTGDAAAELLRQETYDILLTDVVLPGNLNGARLADLAGKIAPRTKVLFMSGYTENAIVHNGQLDPDVELISKPFTRDQLARRLSSLSKQ
ncbi:sensor kinase CckA [Antarctobacter heliothermus]|uniref:histidine kinase n=1 Tax=Antarctobacter heliothermus TaxID=74033 RepID=A0A222DZB8_9RHOB|nr:ATP-binding protein [Antarctobacter heliothermus]ASP19253.1 sensor kinase CckA [Antarctobacter heliothermus]